jgi:lipid II:glycine glycyltransferase (peptidoglycan interpeptide bridge formation enzyme)
MAVDDQEKSANPIYYSSIFSQPWWLDAVAPGQWGEVLVERGNNLFARMPYVLKRKRGFTYIVMPQLTQTLGPWLRPFPGKDANRLSEEKQLMSELINGLPPFDYFQQSFHHSIRNWLPFYWLGFEQTTRYTYVLNDLTNLDAVSRGFTRAKRKNIRRAAQIVEVKHDLPAREFYNHHRLTLAKQERKIIYSFDLFQRIYRAAYEHQAGKILYCIDANDNMHSAIFVVWDHRSAYYLISSIDPDFRNSGSATLLIWEAIQYLADRTQKFDFEGSMIENVENSFRSFGAKQVPYFQVSKVKSLPLKIYRDFRSWGRVWHDR